MRNSITITSILQSMLTPEEVQRIDLSIPMLLGMTENAVYGQLFCALIVYVLLNWLFVAAQTSWPQHAVLSFARFSRLFLLQNYLLNG
ncbi:hypothetical protein MKY24_20790 [Paenibacillus sp. FSL P2-0322]|uniref:Uncharacterized protein n=1 Tax=Paenibacillus polymyxa TaxID=1406 RepID=A0AAP4EAZ4_PAEPO|nr:hypothetical protein [Paenibacillus polymyxa]MDH2331923.1 hypothetical protein [Paenibacillus polymyxa]